MNLMVLLKSLKLACAEIPCQLGTPAKTLLIIIHSLSKWVITFKLFI